MTTRFYLDTRAMRKDGTFPLKLSLAHKGKTTLLPLDVFLRPEDWDGDKQLVKNVGNRRALNSFLVRRKVEIDDALRELMLAGKLAARPITEIREVLLRKLEPEEEKPVYFLEVYRRFQDMHTNARTREIYEATYSKICAHDAHAHELTFEAVTKGWLKAFYDGMEKDSPSVNARNIHLRNIRAVFNYALDEELITCYPFRKVKIKSVQTMKRALPVDVVRGIATSTEEELGRDIFMLIFYLIGINTIDLSGLTRDNINDGRVEYTRAKTKRFYSIKLEPEALALIEKLEGSGRLVGEVMRYGNYKDFAARLNERLKRLRPRLSTYWARHSWATIAANLGVTQETIKKALGHGGTSVTDVYIDYDRTRIDRANRIVIDYVLHGIEPEGNMP